MALVNYPSSSEEETCPAKTGQKRKRGSAPPPPLQKSTMPPLPSKFHDLYTTAARASTTDDPSLHGGKVRAQPHVQGNWPSHVYLEWLPSPQDAALLSNLLSTIRNPPSPQSKSKQTTPQLHSLLTSELSTPLPLHISLSRPLVLQTDIKDEVLDALDKAVRAARVGSFSVTVEGARWVSNEEGTRCFLVLGLRGSGELNKLLWGVNRVLGRKGKNLGSLYEGFEESGFHISIAWRLGAPQGNELDVSRAGVVEALRKCSKDLDIAFESVKIKVGNSITVIPLVQTAQEELGILG
ncbi:MAG: poly(U)-specific 3'-to-5' RNA exonuclease [Vezdaea aestivalis]|nr:MAG: poly(U)-specific 3'-to-5' RNA exonuclease [Vezdaea aestivalis]